MASTATVPQSTSLYNGTIQLSFDAKSHSYEVTENGRVRTVPNVTSILGVIEKPALVQWAANMTTEYIRAAWRPGLRYDEIQLNDILEKARFNFRDASRNAKTIGQLAHEWVESYQRAQLYGTPELPLPVNEQAKAACQAAASWIAQHFKPRSMEHRVYSREGDYAGTIDVAGDVDGVPAIVDFKAAGAVYKEFRLQAAAYAFAWAEMHDERVPDRWVIRLDKETGEFEAVKFPREEFRADLKAFLAAKALHMRLEGMKKPAAAPKVTATAPQAALAVVPKKPGPMAPPPAKLPPAPKPQPQPKSYRRVEGTPRNGRNRQILYARRNGSLILSDVPFSLNRTMKQIFSARGSSDAEGVFHWTIGADRFETLLGLCRKSRITLTQTA